MGFEKSAGFPLVSRPGNIGRLSSNRPENHAGATVERNVRASPIGRVEAARRMTDGAWWAANGEEGEDEETAHDVFVRVGGGRASRVDVGVCMCVVSE